TVDQSTHPNKDNKENFQASASVNEKNLLKTQQEELMSVNTYTQINTNEVNTNNSLIVHVKEEKLTPQQQNMQIFKKYIIAFLLGISYFFSFIYIIIFQVAYHPHSMKVMEGLIEKIDIINFKAEKEMMLINAYAFCLANNRTVYLPEKGEVFMYY